MQTRYNNWKDSRLSDVNNRKDLGIIPQGRWRGFDYSAGSVSTNLLLVHSFSGYSETDEVGASHAPLGLVKTAQGVMVVEDDVITVVVTDNSGGANPRIDLVVLQHTYVETIGGVNAGYSVIVGTPSATPVAPSIPFPLTTIVIGRILWPAGGTDIALATYTQEPAPLIGQGDAGNQDYVTKSTEQTISGNKRIDSQSAILEDFAFSGTELSTLVRSNYYNFIHIDNNYKPIDTITVPTMAVGDITHFQVIFNQRATLISGGNINIVPGGSWHVETGDIVMFSSQGTDIFAHVGRANEVHRDTLTKMFAGVVGNKDTATFASNDLTLSGKANYYSIALDLSTHPQIRRITGYTSNWNQVDTVTKGGNFLVLHVTNSGGAGYFTMVGTGTSSGTFKKLTFADNVSGSGNQLQDGCYVILIENEDDYAVIATFDSNTFPSTLFEYINTVNGDLATLGGTVISMGSDIATLQAQNTFTSWTALTLGTGWTGGTPVPAYRKDGLGRVYLRGRATAGGSATFHIATLPAGAIPPNDTYMAVNAYVGGNNTPQTVLLKNSTGHIEALSAVISTSDIWSIDMGAFLNS